MPRNVGRVRSGDHKAECDVYHFDDVAKFVYVKYRDDMDGFVHIIQN